MKHPKDNSLIILLVVATVCVATLFCVVTLCMCAIYKIPDMSGSLTAGLNQITATLVGALIALLINTRAQEPRQEQPNSVEGRTPSGTVRDPLITIVANEGKEEAVPTNPKP